MKILIDTNVALDILLQRQPWYTNAALVFSFAQRNYIECYISASAITDIFYVAKKDLGKSGARAAMKILLQVFRPATVTDSQIYQRWKQNGMILRILSSLSLEKDSPLIILLPETRKTFYPAIFRQ